MTTNHYNLSFLTEPSLLKTLLLYNFLQKLRKYRPVYALFYLTSLSVNCPFCWACNHLILWCQKERNHYLPLSLFFIDMVHSPSCSDSPPELNNLSELLFVGSDCLPQFLHLLQALCDIWCETSVALKPSRKYFVKQPSSGHICEVQLTFFW